MVKNIFFRCLLLLITLGFLFVAGELITRLGIHWKRSQGGSLEERLERSQKVSLKKITGAFNIAGLVQPSSFSNVIYELKPGLDGTFRNKTVQTSLLGIRDKDYPLQKPTNTVRIVGLGDSVMFGWGVNQGEDYLSVLEERLNQLPPPHPQYEVMNFAVPGYNTAIEVAVYEHKAVLFDPDMVIINFIYNDTGLPLFLQRPKDLKTLSRSYFAEFIITRLKWLRHRKRSDLIGHHFRNIDDDIKKEVIDRYRHMVGIHNVKRSFKRLNRLTRDKNIPAIILVGKTATTHKALIRHLRKTYGFHILSIGPYTDAHVKEHNLGPSRDKIREALWVAKNDHHPNARAHGIYVDGLIDKFRKIGFIPALETAEDEISPER